jgi:hypothetical protein
MENQDKLFNQIKSAAENAETKAFPGIDKVWHRVEEKLDTKETKKATLLWKKIAIAASLLLITTLGYQFFKNEPAEINSKDTVTATDSINKTVPQNDAVVSAETSHPVLKKEAEKILEEQIKPSNQVAFQMPKPMSESITDTPPVAAGQTGYSSSSATQKDSKQESKSTEKEVELFFNKNNIISESRKTEPLMVIDDKVSKKKITTISADDAESIILLKEPLYIINGVEYTEQQLFGPNPTSPYTPLNKQEIEAISILQDEKAIELYGDKGKKGVVIITTKNGKPANAVKAK